MPAFDPDDSVEIKKESGAISDDGDVDVDGDGDFAGGEWSHVADYSDDVDKNDNDVDFNFDPGVAATNIVKKKATKSRKKKTVAKASSKTWPLQPVGPPPDGVDPEVRTIISTFSSLANCLVRYLWPFISLCSFTL